MFLNFELGKKVYKILGTTSNFQMIMKLRNVMNFNGKIGQVSFKGSDQFYAISFSL